jgi:hypothetical protein
VLTKFGTGSSRAPLHPRGVRARHNLAVLHSTQPARAPPGLEGTPARSREAASSRQGEASLPRSYLPRLTSWAQRRSRRAGRPREARAQPRRGARERATAPVSDETTTESEMETGMATGTGTDTATGPSTMLVPIGVLD